MSSIAIIGARGFVGSQLIESLHQQGNTEIRAIVRSDRNIGYLKSFGSGVRIVVADAIDSHSISNAIEGCSTVVNLVTGSAATIVKSTKAIYQACEKKQVKRLVHISSATVFGDLESAEVSDDSLPLKKHWMPYARAKSISELFLRSVMETGSTEVIVLRPGIIWGPNSFHTMNVVSSLINKSAYLVKGGKGIFNSIYIDNLIDCIKICNESDKKTTGFFNVADAEAVTWFDFYAALAPHLDYDMEKITEVSEQNFPFSIPAAIEYIRLLPIFNSLNIIFTINTLNRFKSYLKSKIKNSGEAGNPMQIAKEYSTSIVDRETWHLQKTNYKLPTNKFEHRFNYSPKTSFNDGILNTINWLKQTGKL